MIILFIINIIKMILPEDVINNYPFETNDEQLKIFLINHYNLMTLSTIFLMIL